MRWKQNCYTLHRWVGLIVGLQLLAWSLGGFTFSILSIANVRGEMDLHEKSPPSLRLNSVRLTPGDAAEVASKSGLSAGSFTEVRLRERADRTVYEFLGKEGKALGAVDAVTGEFLVRVSREEAKAVALSDFAPEASVVSVILLEGEPPIEYRGGAMPVYQVILDHPKDPHIYVSPITGEVLKRRNKIWRIFDFFWMLHIMDYSGRNNFNHWLLTTMSVLAILTSASGLVLWWWRIGWPVRSRRRANGSTARPG